MTRDELIALKAKILADIKPLAIEAVGDDVDQFDLLIKIIQTGASSAEVYNKAYTVAQGIESVQDKLDALMILIDEIDFEIQAQMDDEPIEATAE